MLRDIADFFDSFMQLAADPTMRKPAFMVAAGVGIAAFLAARTIYRKLNLPPQLPVSPTPSCEQDLAAARAELDTARAELNATRPLLAKHEALVNSLQGEEDELWRLRGGDRSLEVARLDQFPGRIITFANLKGGVGKTTLAANMASYFDSIGQRVLVIDLDYQGSLSDMLLRASGHIEAPSSKTDAIFDGTMSPEGLLNQVVWLRARHGQTQLLQRTHLLPSSFTLNRAENRAMLKWLLGETDIDVRYNLLRLLSDERVAKAYDVVILDTPPRWSTGTINALAASTHVVVPTILNALSAGNVPVFLKSARILIRNDLNPHLRLAGVVGTMTQREALKDTELRIYNDLKDAVTEVWGDGDGVFKTTIPDKAAIYDVGGERLNRQLFERMGAELWQRVTKR